MPTICYRSQLRIEEIKKVNFIGQYMGAHTGNQAQCLVKRKNNNISCWTANLATILYDFMPTNIHFYFTPPSTLLYTYFPPFYLLFFRPTQCVVFISSSGMFLYYVGLSPHLRIQGIGLPWQWLSAIVGRNNEHWHNTTGAELLLTKMSLFTSLSGHARK